MKAIWTGSISFGLVEIVIKISSLSTSKPKISKKASVRKS